MSINTKRSQWLKSLIIYLIKRLGYAMLLLVICYGAHHFWGYELSLTLIITGLTVMAIGCSAMFGSTFINLDYNYRMTQITNPVARKFETEDKNNSFRFFFSCALVGGTLLMIGYLMN